MLRFLRAAATNICTTVVAGLVEPRFQGQTGSVDPTTGHSVSRAGVTKWPTLLRAVDGLLLARACVSGTVQLPPTAGEACRPATPVRIHDQHAHIPCTQTRSNTPRARKCKPPRAQLACSAMLCVHYVGVVTRIDGDGDLHVDFPEQSGWTGRASEMEVV
jgi:hypothetical protein